MARQVISGNLDSGDARERIREIEKHGDAERAALVAVLHASFITPLDREDLYRLSRSIDDVLDNLRDFVREVDLLNVHDQVHFDGILQAVSHALDQLTQALEQTLTDTADVTVKALAAKKRVNQIRQLYQVAIAQLLAGEFHMDVLKKRELLRRLDVVGLRLGEAADVLADAAMKRSH